MSYAIRKYEIISTILYVSSLTQSFKCLGGSYPSQLENYLIICLIGCIFLDSKALMKMQDALKESKREGERMREKNIILENVKKEMETDLREMQR